MTKALAKQHEAPAPAPIDQGDALLALIERAARDPQADVDKMERLFAMRERLMAQGAKTAYLAALASMQPELPIITKHGVINTNEKTADGQKTGKQKAQSKYARWEDVVEGITPVLAKHGFSLSFRVTQPTADRVSVAAVLGHKEGHTEETALALPLDASGSKNNVQGWGSSVSYGKRYTAFALLNISARGEDDDGQKGGADATIGAEQLAEIKTLIVDRNADIQKFCRYFKIENVEALPVAQYERAIAALKARK